MVDGDPSSRQQWLGSESYRRWQLSETVDEEGRWCLASVSVEVALRFGICRCLGPC